jgi:hypothetical protein
MKLRIRENENTIKQIRETIYKELIGDEDIDFKYEYDDNYDENIGRQFAKDIEDMLYDLIKHSDNVNEEFISNKDLKDHFKKHCIAKRTNVKSNRTNVFYDFKDISQYVEYDKKVSDMIEKTKYTIGYLYDYDKIYKYFRKLFEGNIAIQFCNSCGLKNKTSNITISVIAFSSNVTKNYKGGNTVDICVKDSRGKTITLFPVDVNYLQNKINNIIKKYSQVSDVDKYLFTN